MATQSPASPTDTRSVVSSSRQAKHRGGHNQQVFPARELVATLDQQLPAVSGHEPAIGPQLQAVQRVARPLRTGNSGSGCQGNLQLGRIG